MREKAENKECGNCGAEIICNSKEVEQCFCSKVELSSDTRRFLTKTYFDCLCKSCLESFNQKIESAKSYSFPSGKNEFIEGVHFYKDGNMWVFTELYHILKQSCCGNGCRHCAYGFTKNGRS
ncbi:MAG: cysteine-rich CWC family protein [Ginsengibacter sp.]